VNHPAVSKTVPRPNTFPIALSIRPKIDFVVV
jgi:hypothetical protein